MQEARNAVAALQELDTAMFQPQPDRARGLGFVLETPSDEVCACDSLSFDVAAGAATFTWSCRVRLARAFTNTAFSSFSFLPLLG